MNRIVNLAKAAAVLLAFSLTFGCATLQSLANPAYEARVDSNQYSREIVRLEAVIASNPNSSRRWQAHHQLAQLYISYTNPKRDYSKALENLQLSVQHNPAESDGHELRNWLAALMEMKTQSIKIASQDVVIERLTLKLEKSSRENRRPLLSEIESQRKTIDQLNAKLEETKQEYLDLDDANSELEKYNEELIVKIDMLKNLDQSVEEKRRNYNNNN